MRYLVNGVEASVAEEFTGTIEPDGQRLWVRTPDGCRSALVVRDGHRTLISYQGRQFSIEKPGPTRHAATMASSNEARAPMPGLIVEVFVNPGDAVVAGQKLMVLEAMKMQHSIVAPRSGTLVLLPATQGAQVVEGEVLASIDDKDSNE